MSTKANSKCRTCLCDINSYRGLFDYVEEKYKILDMLDSVVPQIGIKTSTNFSILMCHSCVDKLLIGYKFQQLCIETNKWLYDLLDISLFETGPEQILNPLTGEFSLRVKKEIEDVSIECRILPNQLEREIPSSSASHCVGVNDTKSRILCNICGKDFRYYFKLKEHMRIHNGKSPYVCAECCKTFYTLNGLRVHMKKHMSLKRRLKFVRHGRDQLNTSYPKKPNKLTNSCNEYWETQSFLDVHRVNDKKENETGCKEKEKSSGYFQERIYGTRESFPLVIVKEEIEITPELNEELMNISGDEATGINDYYDNSDDNSVNNLFPEAGKTEKMDGIKVKKNNRHPCATCDKVFYKAFLLKRHSLVHSQTRSYECPICKYRYSTVIKLKAHLSKHKNGSLTKVKSHLSNNDETKPVCSICKKEFTNISHLKEHINSHKGEKLYQCSKCDKFFKFASNLGTHMRIHSEVNAFQCNQCDNTFRLASSLRYHMSKHHSHYACESCGDVFSKPYLLKKHISVHSLANLHECTICNYRFTTASRLKAHLSKHKNGSKRNKVSPVCSICKKKFASNYNLKQHMNLHSGERPYQCAECNKTFKFASNLKHHMDTHSIKSPYQCIHCYKSFCSASGFSYHMNSVHRDNKHKPLCSICGKGFATDNNLKKHMLLHT